MSVLSEQRGAVAGESLDDGVAAHYGDPLREQRMAARDVAVVDRSDRGLVVVTGADRLSWLHSLTSQHLTELGDGESIQGLILSPHGHVEQDLWFTSVGDEVWIDCEPHQSEALTAYLDSMRFMLRVEVEDRSAGFGMLSVVGPRAAEVLGGLLGEIPPAGHARVTESGLVRTPTWPREHDLLGTTAQVDAAASALLEGGVVPAGMLAYDALRVAALRPRLGRETDHRTIPHEIGLIGQAVHLNKGCYRGQETVARVHNLGRPPRRLVRLHLDGSLHTLPHPGAEVRSGTRVVGFVGTPAMHYEDGAVALAVVKRNVADGADLTVTDDDASYAAKVDVGLEV